MQDEAILMKSKERVQKHGEVFTPQWVVEKMISIPGIKEKTEDVFATFLEPSAGEGAFLLAIENLKLKNVTRNHDGETWRAYALWVLSSIYGIEYLEDNLAVARQNMFEAFLANYEQAHGKKLSLQSNLYKSAQTIIWANVVQGDALSHKNAGGEEIIFSHWQLVQGTTRRVQRIPFTYSSLFTDDRDSVTDIIHTTFEMVGQEIEIVERQNFLDPVNKTLQHEPELLKYSITDIEQVWREEKEND
jgi:hypothetical protein